MIGIINQNQTGATAILWFRAVKYMRVGLLTDRCRHLHTY